MGDGALTEVIDEDRPRDQAQDRPVKQQDLPIPVEVLGQASGKLVSATTSHILTMTAISERKSNMRKGAEDVWRMKKLGTQRVAAYFSGSS